MTWVVDNHVSSSSFLGFLFHTACIRRLLPQLLAAAAAAVMHTVASVKSLITAMSINRRIIHCCEPSPSTCRRLLLSSFICRPGIAVDWPVGRWVVGQRWVAHSRLVGAVVRLALASKQLFSWWIIKRSQIDCNRYGLRARSVGAGIRLTIGYVRVIKKSPAMFEGTIDVIYLMHRLSSPTRYIMWSSLPSTCLWRGARWQPMLAQWLIHWSEVTSTTVSTCMGDRQGRSCAVNLRLYSRYWRKKYSTKVTWIWMFWEVI
jgi:hypothetical protein